jgi:hypothetical protein
MKKNVFVLGALALMILAAVPMFAEEPITISGVWLAEDDSGKVYYYFSPGGRDGTAVGVVALPDMLGGQQIVLFTGTWDFEEKDGKQLFCMYGIKVMPAGTFRFISSNAPMPGQGTYHFYSENGIEKMEHIVNGHRNGTEKTIYTKIGTKLSDLPELGPLGNDSSTGGRFWAQNGIVVKQPTIGRLKFSRCPATGNAKSSTTIWSW